MENVAHNYVKFDILEHFLFKKGVNPKSLVAALAVVLRCSAMMWCGVNHDNNYRVSHHTGHLEIWLSARPFINMNWTPEYFLSA